MSYWISNPTRTIHWVVSVLVFLAAVAGDLANALNGTETWFGVAFAVGNLVQAEVNRAQVRPKDLSVSVGSQFSTLTLPSRTLTQDDLGRDIDGVGPPGAKVVNVSADGGQATVASPPESAK